jgi:uncharacterized repeat protein (TIGR03803 family)
MEKVRQVFWALVFACLMGTVMGSVARAAGSDTIVHVFAKDGDGAGPRAPLAIDATGALFGTTYSGGQSLCECGTVFRLSESASGWQETILHRFDRYDAHYPAAGLIIDKAGVLYGTSESGGGSMLCFDGCGSVFALVPVRTGYVERILYGFGGGSDGASPDGSLIMDRTGALYGTTSEGGSSPCSCGTVFKLTPKANRYDETVLYSFQGGLDGAGPLAGLTFDAGGLWGTTVAGGGSSACEGNRGCGTVFKLAPRAKGQWFERVVHRFQSGIDDGASPMAGVIADSRHAVYGTTAYGGVGGGTAFKIVPERFRYAESLIHRFSGNGGFNPYGSLLLDSSGTLFGTTQGGGAAGAGTVFALTPEHMHYALTTIYSFMGSNDGAFPYAGVIESGGVLYGTTFGGGGGCGCGTAYSVTP